MCFDENEIKTVMKAITDKVIQMRHRALQNPTHTYPESLKKKTKTRNI